TVASATLRATQAAGRPQLYLTIITRQSACSVTRSAAAREAVHAPRAAPSARRSRRARLEGLQSRAREGSGDVLLVVPIEALIGGGVHKGEEHGQQPLF